MFLPPSTLKDNVQQFLTLAEAQKILADLNQIFDKTTFHSGLPLLLIVIFWFATHVLLMATFTFVPVSLLGLPLSLVCLFIVNYYYKGLQRGQLINYVADLNR